MAEGRTRTMRIGTGCSSARDRYSRAMSKRLSGVSGSAPPRGGQNRPGSSSNGAADMTPSAPVYSSSRCASARLCTSPLPITGMWRSRLTARMASQSARTSRAFFWSRVRPCTARSDAPALSIMRAYRSVSSSFGKMRIFALTGVAVFCGGRGSVRPSNWGTRGMYQQGSASARINPYGVQWHRKRGMQACMPLGSMIVER